MIEIEDLGVHYPGRQSPALAQIRESVAPGETVVITGPSGCGKSTLCRTLAGFIPGMIPASVKGDVRIGGLSAWTSDAEHLAERVGFVQQDADAQICTLRVEQEVAFGPENLCLPASEVRLRVDNALAAVEIAHLRHRETTSLSGGEKQRLALASILAMEPSILLLDEPTANLDPRGAQRILSLLGRLTNERGLTLVIVEHRLRPILPLNPRLVILDRGHVVERHATREHWDLSELGLRERWAALGKSEATSGKGLNVDDLTFGYATPLLDRLTFQMARGEVLGVIGPNGGGKTTLLRLLAGVEKPSSGSISLCDCTSRGFAFQHPHHQIFEQTVAREIRLDGVMTDEVLDQRLSAARLDGLSSVPPLSLSLGEQRRLTLMTTLARSPGLLLLDEPFIGQDRRNVRWILEQIREARDRGTIVVVVSHDTELIGALSDQLLFLDGDRTILGEPRKVFEQLVQTGQDVFVPGGNQ